MVLKRSKTSFFQVLSIFLLFLLGFKTDQDPLHNRAFNVSLSETRNGVVMKKVIADVFTFKNGKVQSNFLRKKFGFRYIRYRINKDSVYTDSTDVEVRYLEMEATATDEKNVTVNMNFTSLEWDMDGVIKITKNDRLRRYYDFAGREKHGKPKKIRKRDTTKVKVFQLLFDHEV